MGYRESIAKAAQSALKSVGNIAEALTYVSISEGAYDTTTGASLRTEVEYSLKAVVGSEKPAYGEPNAVKAGHTGKLFALFASADLPIKPTTGDEVIRGSERYKVLPIVQDPAGATYHLILERMG